jgi:uncharacterized YigZ family protein
MSNTIIPYTRHRVELRIANSRFIATIAPASSVDQAKVFIDEIKSEFSDASHNVTAYKIGSGSTTITHSSDDGEPSGTAGRPALSVLSGSGIGDAAIVITRYFGGTKLGKGGLVKAYSEAARRVINSTRKANKVPVHQVKISSPYNLYQIISRKLFTDSNYPVFIENEDFTDQVEIIVSVPVANLDDFNSSIKDLTNGKIIPLVVAKNLFKLIPH